MSARRIDTVVRIRRLQEQLASADVARTRQQLDRAARAEQFAWHLVAERSTSRARSLDALLAERAMLDGGMTNAHRLGDVTVTAHHHNDMALHEWRGAMQRLDGIERLSDRLKSAERAEEERKDGVELDDLVVMRWNPEAAS